MVGGKDFSEDTQIVPGDWSVAWVFITTLYQNELNKLAKNSAPFSNNNLDPFDS